MMSAKRDVSVIYVGLFDVSVIYVGLFSKNLKFKLKEN